MFITGPQAKEAIDWVFTADSNKDVNKYFDSVFPSGYQMYFTHIYRLIYTCALNDMGGVEADVTVNVIQSGTGEIHNPFFEVSILQKEAFFKIIIRS